MDPLDCGLHRRLLDALAASARALDGNESRANGDELQLLGMPPCRRADTARAAETAHQLADILDEAEGNDWRISSSDAEVVHALASHARDGHDLDALPAVLRALAQSSRWQVQLEPDAASSSGWPLVDELLHQLASSVLQLGQCSDETATRAVVDAVAAWADAFDNSHPSWIITHGLPALHGLSRALKSHAHKLAPTPSHAPSLKIVDDVLVSGALEWQGDGVDEMDLDDISDDYDARLIAFQTVQVYERRGKPLCASFAHICILQVIESVALATVAGSGSAASTSTLYAKLAASASNPSEVHDEHDKRTGWIDLFGRTINVRTSDSNDSILSDAALRAATLVAVASGDDDCTRRIAEVLLDASTPFSLDRVFCLSLLSSHSTDRRSEVTSRISSIMPRLDIVLAPASPIPSGVLYKACAGLLALASADERSTVLFCLGAESAAGATAVKSSHACADKIASQLLQDDDAVYADLLERLRQEPAPADSTRLHLLARLLSKAPGPSFARVREHTKANSTDALADPPHAFRQALALAVQDDSVRTWDIVQDLLAVFVEESKQGSASEPAKATIIALAAALRHSHESAMRLASGEAGDIFGVFWLRVTAAGLLEPSSPVPLRAALGTIADATPCFLNQPPSAVSGRDAVARNCALSAEKARGELVAYLPEHGGQIRGLATEHIYFLLTIVLLEDTRARRGQLGNVASYLLDSATPDALRDCFITMADKVTQTYLKSLSSHATGHSGSHTILSEHVCRFMPLCLHPTEAVRLPVTRIVNSLISEFPVIASKENICRAVLELLSLSRSLCQTEFTNEYTPVYQLRTAGGQSIFAPDDMTLRRKLCDDFLHATRNWFAMATGRAPMALQSSLQACLEKHDCPAEGAELLRLATHDDLGKSVALDIATQASKSKDAAVLSSLGKWRVDGAAAFVAAFVNRQRDFAASSRGDALADQRTLAELDELLEQMRTNPLGAFDLARVRRTLYMSAAIATARRPLRLQIVRRLCSVSGLVMDADVAKTAIEVWTLLANADRESERFVVAEVVCGWVATLSRRRGLFTPASSPANPLNDKIEYSPTDRDAQQEKQRVVARVLRPHAIVLDFLVERFHLFKAVDKELVALCAHMIRLSCKFVSLQSLHPLARSLRLRLLSFGYALLQSGRHEAAIEDALREHVVIACLAWFAGPPMWSYGSDRLRLEEDRTVLEGLLSSVLKDYPAATYRLTATRSDRQVTPSAAHADSQDLRRLLRCLLEDELNRLTLWANPLGNPTKGQVAKAAGAVSDLAWRQVVRCAWKRSPACAVRLLERFKSAAISSEISRCVAAQPWRARRVPEAFAFMVGDRLADSTKSIFPHLLLWAPIPVASALRLMLPVYGGEPRLLQYAMRVLEHYPVDLTFFYVPQIVQTLRVDASGYAERFIFETTKVSQLFCHQIIWNMKANTYKDDLAEVPDPMKPTLDRLVDMISGSLSGEAKAFYDREFAFFDTVTSISRKLQPFIKKSKPEKKAKIDEEISKIAVDPGVYLPSNPDGVVIDIDRKSGRPLQSHAKAPFMATFQVQRQQQLPRTSADIAGLTDREARGGDLQTYKTWQSAIFKVGDDCRQDVLALQVIAMHKSIFSSIGLDLLLVPYRVTATGPGCGVIDVIPDATSRDEIGRSGIPDLRTFFQSKFGSPAGLRYQQARTNFIQSMAAYSLLCYILQIKDRHNGNIMIDGTGRITHIDFGFLFDIGPGGIKFEPDSFKLSHEMVMLMGGNDSTGLRQFSELVTKAFLACRPYADAIIATVGLMLSADFPSFKGEGTLARLRERFRLELSEVEAAQYFQTVIADAIENRMSVLYDSFQTATNKIPHAPDDFRFFRAKRFA